MSAPLFGVDAPVGFEYRREFVSPDEEGRLADDISRVEFSTFEMRAVAAKRRVAFFGRSYDAGARPVPPIPVFLETLRGRLAAWSGRAAESFAMALINEYPPGAPVGWHRDAPQYDVVAGVSLLSDCRMKFRPYRPAASKDGSSGRRRTATHDLVLERRSAYLMTGESRQEYEHHVPPVPALRYSITFRTLRERR